MLSFRSASSKSAFWLIQTTLLALLVSVGVLPSNAQTAPQGHVIVVTVDGLRPDVIQEYGAEMLPGFTKLMNEGVYTLNARTDAEYTITVPNHTTMMTGRQVGDSQGHNWWFNNDVDDSSTLHAQKGSYVASMFDVAHDHGGRTALFSSKNRFKLFDQSYNAQNGADDVTGPDNGSDKIDSYVYHPTSSTVLLDAFRDGSASSPFDLTLFQIAETDEAGHAHGWNDDPESAYGYSVRLADIVIREILQEVVINPLYAGNTHVIVVSDHGGTKFGHWDPEDTDSNTVPFFVWGPSVQPGDLYAINPSRFDPGSTYLDYDAMAATPPVSVGDVANLALSLLELPPVPGSTINANQSLVVSPSTDPRTPPVAAFSFAVDGSDPLTVTFDGTSSSDADGSVASWQWSFGDGTTGVGSTAQHAYSQSGTYDVTLTITDDDGLSDSSTRTLTVQAAGQGPITMAFQDNMAPTVSYQGTRDTKLMSDAPSSTFGSSSLLEIDGTPEYRALVAWDLSAIPASATVLGGEVVFEVTNISEDRYALFSMNRSWSESEANWQQATSGDSWTNAGLTSLQDRSNVELAGATPSSLGAVSMALNAAGIEQVQAWIDNPASNHGFVLEASGEAYDGMDVASSEASSPNDRPRLVVTYTLESGQSPNQEPTAIINAGAVTGEAPFTTSLDGTGSFDPDGSIISWSWDFGDGTTDAGSQASHTWDSPGSYSVRLTVVDNLGASATAIETITVLGPPASNYVFQDGVYPDAGYAGTRDTKLLSDSPDTAFGSQSELEVDGAPEGTVLMSWDLSSIPPGTTIQSARITLDVTNPSFDTYELYGVNRVWDESSATWQNASTGNSWNRPGASGSSDRESVVVGVIGAYETGLDTFELNQDGIALIQSWVDNPNTNRGFAIQDFDDAWDGLDFSSRESSVASLRPKLEIETGSSSANRIVTVASDTGSAIAFGDGNAAGWSQRAPLLLRFRSMLQDFPNLRPVALDHRSGDEIRVRTSHSLMAVVLSPESDSLAARGRLNGFSSDGSISNGGTSWMRWIRVLPAGSHSLDIVGGEYLFLESSQANARSVDSETPLTRSEDSVEAYPNPFRDALQLRFAESGERVIELVDMVGRRVLRVGTSSANVRLDTGAVTAGTYVLRVLEPDGSSSSRMVTRL